MKKSSIRRLLLPLVAMAVTIWAAPLDLPAIAQSNPAEVVAEQPAPGDGGIPIWVYAIGSTVLILIFLPKIGWVMGLIVISDREVGIIIKKFSNFFLKGSPVISEGYNGWGIAVIPSACRR